MLKNRTGRRTEIVDAILDKLQIALDVDDKDESEFSESDEKDD